jgi:PAS domain S-box-containing protein
VAQNAFAMLVFIVSSSLSVFFAIKKVTKPLAKLTEKVKALGKGLPVEPMEVETGDEIGKVASAFNAMVVERGRAEESLRQSERRFRLIAETIAEVFWMSDVALKKMLYISPQYERVWGRSLESLYEDPRSFLEAIHPEDRVRVLFDYDAKKSGKAFDHQYRIIRPDGSIRMIWDRGYPVKDEEGGVFCYVGAAQDITEYKGMETRIRAYQKELRATELEMSSMESRIEKRERHLIAADLHDFVGQNLVVTNFKLGMLRKYISAIDGARHLEEIQGLIVQTIQYTRSLTVELSPQILFEVGFSAAIESLAKGFEKTHELSIDIKDDGLPKRVDDDTSYLLYRCVRELLMNVVKHSKAGKVTISIATQGDMMEVSVEDNGLGFDARTVNKKQGGFGLFSINERCKRAAGHCTVETKPGFGTKVILAVPIKR